MIFNDYYFNQIMANIIFQFFDMNISINDEKIRVSYLEYKYIITLNIKGNIIHL